MRGRERRGREFVLCPRKKKVKINKTHTL